MHETINEEVSVIALYDRKNRATKPLRVKWQGKVYEITKIGYHHPYRDGRVKMHVYNVATETLAMRLELNTETLHWVLKEVSDGLAD